MPIDREQALALELPDVSTTIERGRLRFFARATNSSSPMNFDVDAARIAGYRDLPVPPTYFFSLELDASESLGYLSRLGVDMRNVLHGEQSFEYHHMAFAGDSVVLKRKIVDCYSRRGGSLEFLVKQTDCFRSGELIAEAQSVIVVQNREVEL